MQKVLTFVKHGLNQYSTMRLVRTTIFFIILILLNNISHSQKPDAYFETPKSFIKFIENKGQWEEPVLFEADIHNGRMFFEKNVISYLFFNGQQLNEHHHNRSHKYLDCHSIKIRFLNSNYDIDVIGKNKSSEYYNYFLGRDPNKWASGVNAFEKLYYKNLYDGIDLEIVGYEENIKYVFYVHSGSDPGNIKLEYIGTDKIDIKRGELIIKTSLNEIIELKPETYQGEGNGDIILSCRYKLNKNVLSFDFPKGYDPSLPIIIDPVVIFSSYSGSTADNFGYTATYDDSGYAYSAGTVFSVGFPVTTGAFQITFKGGITGNNPGSGGGRDIGILKYTPDGRNLVYVTYLGGACNEDPHSMVVDTNYNLVVFGNTCSKDFPIPANFYDSSYNDSIDIYLAKLSSDGKNLLAATFIGGKREDGLNGYFNSGNMQNQMMTGYNYGDVYRGEVNIDSNNNIFVITSTKSSDFPVTTGVFQQSFGGGRQDAVLFKIDNNLSNLLAASFIGGTNNDAGFGIDFNSKGDVYVCGGTISNNLPMVSGKYKTSYQGGGADGYIYVVNNNLTTLLSSSYIGTNVYDQTYFIQSDNNDNVYVYGQTKSDNFLVRNVNYYNVKGKQFVMKLNPGLDSVIYSTTIGSGRLEPDLSPSAFLVDFCERIYISGWGGTTNHTGYNLGYTNNLPVTNDAFQLQTDGSDFYIGVFAKDFQNILYGTYFGGNVSAEHVDGGTSRFDKHGKIYQSVCAGCWNNSDLPTYPNDVWSSTNNSTGCNNAIIKIDLDIPDLLADFAVDTIFCLAEPTNIVNNTIGGSTYYWDFGDGDTSGDFEPRHIYADTGLYNITLYVSNIFSCDQHDTISKNILVYDQAESDFIFDTFECINYFSFKFNGLYGNKFYWDFGDSTSSYERDPFHLYSDTGEYQVTFIVDSGTACEHRTYKNIRVDHIPVADFSFTIDTCFGRGNFTNLSKHSSEYLWQFGDGDSSFLESPSHEYKIADSFEIYLIAEYGKACADTSINRLYIRTPKADAILSIDTCYLSVLFMNPSKYVTESSFWDFGDGIDTVYIDTVWHKYSLAGTYDIVLVANLGTICIDTVRKQITLPELPISGFKYTRDTCSPYVVFENQSLFANKFFWNFGNGDTSLLRDPTEQFDTSGLHFIDLIAYSPASCVDTFIDSLFIDHLAHAEFTFEWDSCEKTVHFTNNSSRSGSYMWDYGDGNNSDEESIIHDYEYDTSGDYLVTLIVNDSFCYDTTSLLVIIIPNPPISFDVAFDSCLPRVMFESYSHGAVNYFWDFGDSQTSNAQDTFHIYEEPGNYTVIFYINYDTTCTNSASKVINVKNYSIEDIKIPNVFTPNNDGMNDFFEIKGLDLKCDTYKLLIYNRWGQLVFESDGNNFSWDGMFENELVPNGVYYYVFESSEFSKAGTATVIY